MIFLLAWLACGGTAWSEKDLVLLRQMSPLPPPPASPSNRYADDPSAAALGKQFFFDSSFSADGTVACATCHLPEKHYTNGTAVATTSRGTGKRNVPSAEGAAWNTWFFWDGRADSAWAQATGPLTNPIEHATTAEAVRERVLAAYAAPFGAVFGGVSEDPQQVLAEVGKAIEAFERTLVPKAGRFDRYVAALPEDTDILTESEKRGLRMFIRDGGCVNCHHGPMFTDRSFHNIGVPFNGDMGRLQGAKDVLQSPMNCKGAYSDTQDCAELQYLDPKFADWPAAFKTPSLRNVAETAPYMHDGSLPTLGAVLNFYNMLPGPVPVGHRELTLEPLHFTSEELQDLEAFLGTLSSEP